MGGSVCRKEAVGAVEGQAEKMQLPLGTEFDSPCYAGGSARGFANDIESRHKMTMYDLSVIELVVWQCFCPLKNEHPLG
jgi:hypothetical protein